MPSYGWGGTSSGGSYSGSGHLWSDGIPLPTGRAMYNGSVAVLVTMLHGYVGGRGGPRTVQLQLGSAITGAFGVPARSDSAATGWYGTNPWLVAGGTATFHVHFSGGFLYFGHGGAGHTNHGSGSGWAGNLGGNVHYVQAPTAPHSLLLSSDSADSVTASWSPPSDTGETPIVGYHIQYSKTPDFSDDVQYINVGPTTTATIEGLDAGDTYYLRVFAKNAVTEAVGTVSVASSPASITIASTGTVLAGIPAEFTENPGAFWSLTGHNVGFDSEGAIVPLEEAAVTFDFYNTATASFETVTALIRRNAAWANDYNVISDKVYARGLQGDSFLGLVANDGSSSVQTVAFKTILTHSAMTFSWQGGPIDAPLGTGQFVSLTIDPLSDLITLTADYREAGFAEQASDSASIAALDATSELAVYLTYEWNINTRVYDVYASVREADSYTSSISVELSYTADGIDVYTDPWQITGDVRALLTANLLSGAPITDLHEWENEPSYVVSGSIPTDGPVPSYRGNVWEYLQMAASGTGCEFTYIDGVITILPIGVRVLDVTNIVGSPTVQPQSLFTGRAVEISYSNARPVSLGAIYDASVEGNRTFSVEKNEVRTESVAINGSPQTLLKPSPTGVYPNPLGTYYVIDSNGEPVSPTDWVEYGASVSVSISEETSNVINVTVTGPIIDIIGSPGPYIIGNKVNSESVGTLKIVGSGLSTNPQTLTLLTGADAEKTPQEVSGSINNIFIADLASAYDRGIWASTEATTRVTLTGTLPLSAVEHFGLVQGSLVRYAENVFRIVDATLSNIDVDFTAEAYCLVADFDARWVDQTVSDHDAHWSGYQAQDERIMPLR